MNNLAALVLRHVDARPAHVALVLPRSWDGAGGGVVEDVLTYGDIGARVRGLMTGLARAGIGAGDRIIVLVPPGPELFTLVIALFGVGATAVLIDAGMSKPRIVQAMASAGARGIVSVGKLLARWPLLPPLWRVRRWSLDSHGRGVAPFSDLMVELAPGASGEPSPALPRRPDDEGLITFTSGSTGRPKGADRTQGILLAQHHALAAHVPRRPDAVDMPCFPVVALHNLCLGITTVMPPCDLRAPASADGALVLRHARKWGVTSIAGAPAFMARLAEAGAGPGGERVPTLERYEVGGAPVTRALCAALAAGLPGAHGHVIYGSTEAEPIGGIEMAELLATPGQGFLVGRPDPACAVELVSLPPEAGGSAGQGGPRPLPEGLARYRVAPGQPGEVIVSGAHVNRRYVGNPGANRENKLEVGGTIWHRTGDVGHLDGQGRLWLTGRVSDLVAHAGRTLHPLIIEAALDAAPGVRRSALVAHPRAPEGEVALELDGAASTDATLTAARAALAAHDLRLPIRVVATIPVDGRHNSKIDRPTLRRSLEKEPRRAQ